MASAAAATGVIIAGFILLVIASALVKGNTIWFLPIGILGLILLAIGVLITPKSTTNGPMMIQNSNVQQQPKTDTTNNSIAVVAPNTAPSS